MKDIWDAVIHKYSKWKVGEINKMAMELLQEQRSALEYSNKSTYLWNEFDFYQYLLTDPTPREYVVKGRNYKFLTRSYSEFENVQSQLSSIGTLAQPENQACLTSTNMVLTQGPPSNNAGPMHILNMR